MALTPGIQSIIDSRIWQTSHLRREDLVDEIGGVSSRGQEGRRCKLNCTPNPKTASPHWK